MNLGGVIHLNKTGICIVCGCILILFLYVFSKNGHLFTEKSGVNLKDVLKVAIHAAENGGVQVVSTKDATVKTKGKTKEGADEHVTSADFNSHCAMIGILKRAFPNFNIISEEKIKCKDDILEKNEFVASQYINGFKDNFVDPRDITVWIDPLDATQEYTEKLSQFVTTMVCVAVKGQPVIGVIHKPFSKETYWGWVGNGHSSNLVATLPDKETKGKIIISRSHSGKINELIEEKFAEFSVIKAGGAGYKVLELINGNADVYIHNTAIKKWDICAGNAILNTMGGKMTTLSGDSILYGTAKDKVNMQGLLAVMRDYDFYLKKL